MCGIIGYIGKREAPDIILDGLKRLEYRGYDSSGLAVIDDGKLHIRRFEGKLVKLQEDLKKHPLSGKVGIGHTRWATHGRPSDHNAHPHRVGDIAVVHNGIIENYAELKKKFLKRGHTFNSETDTEIIAHLIHHHLQRGADFEKAVQKALKELAGSYAIVALDLHQPDTIIAAKKASPLLLGLGEGENFVASDIPALISHTRNVVPLEENEYAVIRRDSVAIRDQAGKKITRRPREIQWTPTMAEKGGFKHFMLKEIFEQPRAAADTMAGRVRQDKGQVRFEDFGLKLERLRRFKKIAISACGTAYHAGLVGKYMLEKFARIPVEVDIASEFRYRMPLVDRDTLLILVSQSGETADTLAALEEGGRRGATTLSICNVLESSIARHSHAVIYTRAGPEIGVASTKAFVTQLVVLYLFAVHLGGVRGVLTEKERSSLLHEALRLPGLIENILKDEGKIIGIARRFYQQPGFFYTGRGVNFPIAMEGALKLKEISYIHAEGYPAGELKHGPIALVDEHMPVVVLAPRNELFEKTLSNLEEVAARKGLIIALVNPGDARRIKDKCAAIIPIPVTSAELTPILLVIPLQLLAYHIAELNGTDVDQPRNLAKSVTVE